MRPLFLLLVVLLLASLGTPPAFAATPSLTFDTTERVRVEAPTVEPFPITGSLLGVTGDTLIVSAPGNDYFIPIGLVLRFEKSLGKQSGATAGAILGLALGAAVGAAIGSSSSGSRNDFGASQGINAAGAALAGGLIGALIGGSVGSSAEGESWKRIPLEELRKQIRAQAAKAMPS